MPEDVKCIPGQPPAEPGSTVVITRVGGFPASRGEVKLVASDKRDGVLDIVQWSAAEITVRIPASPPGPAPYWIKVNSQYSGPIDIRSQNGGSYPPTHPPTH